MEKKSNMWNKIIKFISRNFAIIFAFVVASSWCFIKEGFKETLKNCFYLFILITVFAGLFIIMWRIIAGFWFFDTKKIKEYTKKLKRQSKKEQEKNQEEARNYVFNIAIIAALIAGAGLIIIGLLLKIYIHYKTGNWWIK